MVDGKADVIRRVSIGDFAFIYESKSGRTLRIHNADGSFVDIPRHLGREGIVALVEIVGAPHEPEQSRSEIYADGTKRWWRYYAPTVSVNSAGFIPRERVASILGYSVDYVFRGFGESKSGLKEISTEIFNQLHETFVAIGESVDVRKLARGKGGGFGPGGEGPIHLEIKMRIAADPSGVLGEQGLKLWKVEWPFPTADCIDVMLRDRHGRFVAVEVEVDCAANEVIGPLQCMKYRSMTSYFFDRPLEEVRTMLVARSIHPIVRERCERFGIQWIELN